MFPQLSHRNLKSTQSGAVLVTALVFLVIMTLLALSSITTNTLEERMAANIQEINRSFQAAETGLAIIMVDDTAFETANTVDDNGTPGDPTDDIYTYDKADAGVGGTGGYSGSAGYRSAFVQKTTPPRGSGWDSSMAFYFFDFESVGSLNSGASTTLHAGGYQVGKN
jgi:type IV pilus assembly protein PilX